jgi:hypothetical protein
MFCPTINDLPDKSCQKCGRRRQKGSHALTHDELRIGELLNVLTGEREHWVYNELSVEAVRVARR